MSDEERGTDVGSLSMDALDTVDTGGSHEFFGEFSVLVSGVQIVLDGRTVTYHGG